MGRVKRHFRKNKKKRWHIDYLLEEAKLLCAIVKYSEEKEECEIARKLMKKFDYIENFGATDCKCKSHLFYFSLK